MIQRVATFGKYYETTIKTKVIPNINFYLVLHNRPLNCRYSCKAIYSYSKILYIILRTLVCDFHDFEHF